MTTRLPPPPPPSMEEAWQEYLTNCVPDARELSIYQIERTKEIWTAGYKAGRHAKENKP